MSEQANNGQGLQGLQALDVHTSTDDQLVRLLRDLGHTLRFLFEGKGSQRRILIILHRTGGLTQRELTEYIGVKPGSASEVLGKLEDAGLIQRTPSETDRRTMDIRLTPAGWTASEQALQQRQARHQEMFSCLSEEEKAALLEMLKKLGDDWHVRYHTDGRGHGHPCRHDSGEQPDARETPGSEAENMHKPGRA